MQYNIIYHGNCVDIMHSKIVSGTIDMIYADPPYNLSGKSLNLISNKTGGPFYKMNEAWDTWDYDKYAEFTKQWMSEAYKVLKTSGSIYISCTYHNIGEVIITGKKLGFKLNNIIVWYKSNAMPNITKRTFTHATEYIVWFVRGKNWKFNYSQLKLINPEKTRDGQLKQMRDFIELPIVQGKERIRGSDGRAIHPTQKPEKLIEIIVAASSSPGDCVLDPFFGTGTTGIVAKKLGRKWIGIEINKDYIKIANRRIQGEQDVR